MTYKPAVLNTIVVVKFSLARKGVGSAQGSTHFAQTACAYLNDCCFTGADWEVRLSDERTLSEGTTLISFGWPGYNRVDAFLFKNVGHDTWGRAIPLSTDPEDSLPIPTQVNAAVDPLPLQCSNNLITFPPYAFRNCPLIFTLVLHVTSSKV